MNVSLTLKEIEDVKRVINDIDDYIDLIKEDITYLKYKYLEG